MGAGRRGQVSDDLRFDWDLIRRYDTRGPRYTSYPTALQFDERFSADDYADQVRRSNAAAHPAPLSVYIHIPFCEHLCFYCACNKIATRNRDRAAAYLDALLREIDLKARLFEPRRRVEQIHFGGGTPTFLTPPQLGSILDRLKQWFDLSGDASGDYSIEIDPRTVAPEHMHDLRELGFNRVSLGVQDFDPAVQQAVHRIQSPEQTLGILQASRDAGVRSVNVDLIYGLPKQTPASMQDTLSHVLEVRPDRISLFNYAHIPARFPAQRRIADADLPNPEGKLEILRSSVETITAAGYLYIGMDHFALPDDELARARADGTLHRSFQGYTTHSACELVAFGVSSIEGVGRCFSQNAHRVEDYRRRVEDGRLPVARGTLLDDDDLVRAHVIDQLMCFGTLSLPDVEQRFGVDFAGYFEPEMNRLGTFVNDGLLRVNDDSIKVTGRGRMLVRNICASFDKYLHEHQADRFSKTI